MSSYSNVFPGQEAVSAAVEECAYWVDQAKQGVMLGASDYEDSIRAALDQFWKLKAQGYPAEIEAGRAQLERLDVSAHGIWGALEQGKIFSASPSYWSYWSAFMFGGNPPRPDSQEAAFAAVEALEGAKAAAARAGQPTLEQYFERSKSEIPGTTNAADEFWKQRGAINAGGIPWWLWLLAGGAALVWWRSSRG